MKSVEGRRNETSREIEVMCIKSYNLSEWELSEIRAFGAMKG
jgi:hypothetical protein